MPVVSACPDEQGEEHEVELHGLADTGQSGSECSSSQMEETDIKRQLTSLVTSDDLMTCFASSVKVKGLLLQQDQTGQRYARLWLWSRTDKEAVLALREPLAKLNLAIREKEEQTTAATTSLMTDAALTPEVARDVPCPGQELPLQAFPEFGIVHNTHAGKRTSQSSPFPARVSAVNRPGDQPRNLYVVGLPPGMLDDDFRAMFERFGRLEHCKVLEQPDGMGRKRGFITFSTHKESFQVMMVLSGSFVRGFRIDISWALRQMEPEQLCPARRASQITDESLQAPGALGRCSVIVDNLDPNRYKTLAQIRAAFATFGTVVSVSVLSPRVTVEVEFTSPVAVAAVLKQDGIMVGAQRLSVYLPPLPQYDMPHIRHNRAWSLPSMPDPSNETMEMFNDSLIWPTGQATQTHLPPFDPFGDSTDTALMQAWRRRINTPLDEADVSPVPTAARTVLRGDCTEFTPSQPTEPRT